MLALASMNSITSSVPIPLVCHHQTPSEAIGGIEVLVGGAPGDSLNFAFIMEGDLSSLRIPEPRSSQRAGGLCMHTCFEVFVMAEDGPGYREFNFSPSGEWAVYAFRNYRSGGELELEVAPGILVRRARNRLELDAKICHDFLQPGRSFRLGLSAVVEDAEGALSYWALWHPPGKPDFHHTDAFALNLGCPVCMS
jgi:hypothetical protein